MTTPVSRGTVQTFLQAFASRDLAKLGPCLHDDILWTIVGPVEMIRFCGERRGKAAVLDLIGRIIPAIMKFTGFDPEILLVDGDRCATLARISGVTPCGRVVSYRCTQFVRFQDDKVIEYRAITDTFDAAEQLLGHPLERPAEAAMPDHTLAGDLVAV